MDSNKVIKLHNEICLLVPQRELKKSFDTLSTMLTATTSSELYADYDNLLSAYKNMLSYFIDDIEDPEREKIFTKLMQAVLKLADRVKQDILSRNSSWKIYWLKREVEKEQRLANMTIVESVDDLLFKSELDDLLQVNQESSLDPKSEKFRKHKLLINKIFNHFWLTDYYGEVEESLIGLVMDTERIKWYEQSIFVTAITLSLLRTWQEEKLLKLIALYQSGKEHIMERALAGVVISLHVHDCRYKTSPDIQSKIIGLKEDSRFNDLCRVIFLQISRARETEKVTKKLHEEIIPKVAKMRPMIDENYDDKNPDWTTIFNESEDVYKSMEELTNLQMEGVDVYMSAFSNLKNFDFFNETSNWFLPFYPEHEALNEVFSDDILGSGTDDLAEALFKTPFICNSDKYSLVHNLRFLPPAQKKMMLKVFKMELEGLQQLNEDNLASLRDNNRFKTNVTQYLQDLYRFFKLSPSRKEFEDIFKTNPNIIKSSFFKVICDTTEEKVRFADYFFNKDFYDDALFFYLDILKENPNDSQLYEKIGFCYQKSSRYDEALSYYGKAEMIDRKAWTLKKIGLCLRHLGKDEKALEYYLQASDLEPSNMRLTLNIAHCYLDLKEYENALRYYFKVEYSDSKNASVLKLIGFCYLASGKFIESDKYYGRLQFDDIDGYDSINMGHLALLQGDRRRAAERYKQALEKGLSQKDFVETMNEDKEWVCPLGADVIDYQYIIDYSLFPSTSGR